MTARARILLVDDDGTVRRFIRHALTGDGYAVLEAADGRAALTVVQQHQPDLIILDVAMPGLDGFQTLAKLRHRGFTQPVLMLSTLHDVDHRVQGLGIGADDYIGKPCDLRELIARVTALLRRTRAKSHQLKLGDITVDLHTRTAKRSGTAFALTGTEFNLLEVLARAPGKPVSRAHLLDAVWGYAGAPATRTLETHMWRLRRKLGDAGPNRQWLHTVAGVGYALSPAAVVSKRERGDRVSGSAPVLGSLAGARGV